MSRPLPKFEQPPVVEVAISVYFRPLAAFKTAHFGSFWALNKDGYPSTEDQMPVIESAGAELIPLPPLRRVFLISANNNYVIQLQPDFFAHNWRKTHSNDSYPSFEKAKALFIEKWRLFEDFVSNANLGEIHPSRYEVTYVNHLFEAPGAFPLAIEKYSPLLKLRQATGEHFLPNPRSLSADLQFEIENQQGLLRVSLKQGVRLTDRQEIMQLDISATKIAKEKAADMTEWLEIGHEWIVRGFTDLTSGDAHKIWKRIQ